MTSLVLTSALAIQTAEASPSFPIVQSHDVQPLLVNVGQVIEAMESLGTPFGADELARLRRAASLADDAEVLREVESVFDAHCLVFVHMNPELRVKVEPGLAARRLVQGGWKPFLVKIQNEAGWTGPLGITSPQAGPVFGKEYCSPWDDINPVNSRLPPLDVAAAEAIVRDRWLDIEFHTRRPMNPTLHGLALEYAILAVRGRDTGRRAALLSFDAGQGTQDLGFRGEIALTFECLPATEVTLRVRDEHGRPAIGAFLVRDEQNRIYPSPFKRLAPDFFFQPQVYRADGETLSLAPGEYLIEFTRGPESVKETRRATVGTAPMELEFQVRRWIDAAGLGYFPGDHHIHGAGCAHYTTPSVGVYPADVARQIHGEDLRVGAVLTWGPGFDFQKNFFTGRADTASSESHILRYDIEVSGFGSYRAGHLCLLRLTEDNYPGGDSVEHWPTLGLNILKWAKRQGAITGSPHSAGGLQISGRTGNLTAVYPDEIPYLDIPSFDGTGAVEYLINITHGLPGPDGYRVPAIDFIGVGNTETTGELTIWYHTLNCGFRQRIAGETDFPCLSGDKVGHGRSYLRVDGPLTYENWCRALAEGKGYVSEGRSHLVDFTVNETLVGEGLSEERLPAPGRVKVRAKVAALLYPVAAEENLAWGIARSVNDLTPPPQMLEPVKKPEWQTRVRPYYWHIERARIPGTRRVPVELIVNGRSVARKEVEADGALREVEFDVHIAHSSWIALRILRSSHTNPIFVLVDGRPIRASRSSAEWCLASVDAVWSRKSRFYAEGELPDAHAAFDHARETYRSILAESPVD